MLVFILVTIATAVAGQQLCPPDAHTPKLCTFMGTVSTMPDRLQLTCRCQISETHGRFQSIKINEKTHHKEKGFLAVFTIGQPKPELDKYNQNYRLPSNRSSINANLAVLVLVFSNLQPRYHFTCAMFSHNVFGNKDSFECGYTFIRDDHYPTTTTTTTTTTFKLTTTTTQPVGSPASRQDDGPVAEKISSDIIIIIVTASLLIIGIGLVVFIIARRRRSRPEHHYPDLHQNSVPLELVTQLLQAVTSSNVPCQRHLTPQGSSLSLLSASHLSGTVPSGSYAEWESSVSSHNDVVRSPRRHHDVTTDVLSENGSSHSTRRKRFVGDISKRETRRLTSHTDNASMTSDEHSEGRRHRRRRQRARTGQRSDHSDSGASSVDLLPSRSFDRERGRRIHNPHLESGFRANFKPRRFSPVNVHHSPFISHRDLPPIPLTPPSPSHNPQRGPGSPADRRPRHISPVNVHQSPSISHRNPHPIPITPPSQSHNPRPLAPNNTHLSPSIAHVEPHVRAERRPGYLLPVNVHLSPSISHPDIPPTPLTPPSPELLSLPMAPPTPRHARHPRHFSRPCDSNLARSATSKEEGDSDTWLSSDWDDYTDDVS
ncbi:uncharacterized protein [Littorina saxatilis]|uniref:Uncharacterized protein n=2 Tax=Littorina saxatilis TaxID=31220 RepID=A0AAN9B6B3_9CAEN